VEALLILAIATGTLTGLKVLRNNSREKEKELLREKLRRWQERQRK
jgi:hypothetical protein